MSECKICGTNFIGTCPHKPNKGYHSKSEMRRMEHMQAPAPRKIWRFLLDDNYSAASARETNAGYGEHKRKVHEFVEAEAYAALAKECEELREITRQALASSPGDKPLKK